MSPLVEEALRAIESGSADIVREGFYTLAEVVAVNRIQNFRSDIPAANDEILEWAPLEEIQRAVQHWIEVHPDHPCVCSAFWVLDKFHDESLRPFLRHWLDHYVQRIRPHLAPLGQILVDLDSLGERAFTNDSFSANEHGKNLDDAIKYLRATEPRA
jgi:hypothetical protein